MRTTSIFGGATRFVIALTACIAVLLVCGALTVRYVVVELPAEIARRTTNHAVVAAHAIATEVAQAFQVRPKVTVNERTIVEQQNDVLQLVTLQKTITRQLRLDDSWMHSTKTLEIEADFVVRAGFNLKNPFVIAVEQAGSNLRVTLPPAQILDVDVKDVRFLRDESGLWNKLTPADRETALRNLRQSIELETRKSDLPQQARAIAEKRIGELLTPGGRTVNFEPERKP